MRKLFFGIISVALLSACTRHYVKTEQTFKNQSLRDAEANQVINDSLARYTARVNAETNRFLVKSESTLIKEGAETTLGNFVCDALQHYGDSAETGSIVILNRGGLRANLPAGNILVKNIFELMPFENEVVILAVKGKDVLAFASLLASKKHPFKGINVVIKNNIATVSYNGKPVAMDDEFTVITSDYLANGGDGFDFLKNAEKRKSTGKLVRNAIIEYCEYLGKNGLTIKPYKDGRLEISE